MRTPSRMMATTALVPPPVAMPTRRQIDSHFPSVGLTVSTGPNPWFEVLLATDPSLFDPARATGRSATTFYASRADGGLTPALDGVGRYVVPASVLGRFLTAVPRPGAIHYLVVSYPDPTGTGGVPGTPGSVRLSPSLTVRNAGRTVAQALTRALTAPVIRVAPVDGADAREGEDGRDLPRSALPPTLPMAASRGLTGDDRLEGEDGGDVARAGSAVAPAPPPSPPPPIDLPAEPAPAAPSSAAASSDWSDYEDGWEGWDRWGEPGRVAASAAPGLDDEYGDLDWGGGLAYDADVPAPLALDADEPPAPTAAPPGRLSEVPALHLEPAVARRIVERATDAADGSAYSAINADGAFRGRFGPDHKAYGRFHTGLSYGIAGFNQDAGTLGQLLTVMRERDPAAFTQTFGAAAPATDPAAVVAELMDVVTAPGPSSEHVEGGRGPRVQPVVGADLWEEPWVARFREAGRHPAFQAAQNQLAAELFLAPMLPLAAGFGLATERGLCLLLDRAVNLGVDGARRWVADTAGPISTPALRQQALAALGLDSIEAFQRQVAGLLVDGEFGPLTHAALTAALRLLGPASPIPLPTTEQLLDAMAARAGGETAAARFLRLRRDPELGDEVLAR